MGRSVLETARSLLSRRKFQKCLEVLEPADDFYRDSFDYQMTAGLACLYLGDTGNANLYFQKARGIRVTDPTLLNAQAVLFLRCKDSKRAAQYYLDVLEIDPKNKIAVSALGFIRYKGSDEEILRLIDSGDIKRFYPPLGPNPDIILKFFFSAVLGVLIAMGVLFVRNSNVSLPFVKNQSYYEAMKLTKSEVNIALQKNLEAGAVFYSFKDKAELEKSLGKIVEYIKAEKDNLARVEINRILDSNANEKTKNKVKAEPLLYINAIDPDIAKFIVDSNGKSKDTNFPLKMVSSNPYLYSDCLVMWSGKIANPQMRSAYECDLLVGYGNGKSSFEGVVHVKFKTRPDMLPEPERNVTIFGRIKIEDGKFYIEGINVTNHVLNQKF